MRVTLGVAFLTTTEGELRKQKLFDTIDSCSDFSLIVSMEQ